MIIDNEAALCEKPRLRFLFWHAEWTTEKRRQAAALQSVPHGAPTGEPVRNCVEFEMLEIKRRQRSRRSQKESTLLPGNKSTR